jgi:argininosuccinate lyase
VKMWSGRFRQPLDPEFEKWQRSFPYDQRLLPFELASSRAHASALKNARILCAEEFSQIIKGLETIASRAESSADFLRVDQAEDVHHYVEKQLAALIGDTAYKLHTGRSRNEQIATDLRLFVRENIDTLQNLIADWIGAILDRAESAETAAMPAYTHLQPAEPVLVAHWLLAYVEMFLRDASRLTDCRKRVNVCPLGSGAIAGATLSLDRQAIAIELGFDAPTANSMDATSDRDFAIEYVDALAMLALHLSRWAEEMILFSTPAYGFVELPEPFSTGSSAMPQKQKSRLAGVGARQGGPSPRLLDDAPHARERPSPCLQQRFAGDAGSSLRRLRHGHRHVAARHRVYEERRIQSEQNESSREFRFYECMGCRGLSRATRSAFAPRS